MSKLTKINKEDFGVYIWTSNQLMHCVPAWAYLFNKYWPWEQKVRVLGYNLPNYDLPIILNIFHWDTNAALNFGLMI